MQPITLNFTDVMFVHAHIDYVDHTVFAFVERINSRLGTEEVDRFVTVLFEVRIYASFICVAFAENLEYSPILWWME